MGYNWLHYIPGCLIQKFAKREGLGAEPLMQSVGLRVCHPGPEERVGEHAFFLGSIVITGKKQQKLKSYSRGVNIKLPYADPASPYSREA